MDNDDASTMDYPGLKTRLAFGMIFCSFSRRQRCRRRRSRLAGDYSAGLQPSAAGRHERPALYSSRRQPEHPGRSADRQRLYLAGRRPAARPAIQLESEGNASVGEQTRQQLIGTANAPFSEALTIPDRQRTAGSQPAPAAAAAGGQARGAGHRPALAQQDIGRPA